MIIAVHAVTLRRNTRPRAVTFLGTGEQEDDRIDKGGRQSLRQSWQWRIYPQGPGPATLLQPLQTLKIPAVLGATNPLQGATSRYNLRHF